MLQLGQITPAIYSNLHTTMINNMFVSDETVLGLYQFLQLQISVFFSSFTKVVIQLGGKNLARHFFPLPLESERKVVKPGASSPGFPNPEMNLKQKDESKAIHR